MSSNIGSSLRLIKRNWHLLGVVMWNSHLLSAMKDSVNLATGTYWWLGVTQSWSTAAFKWTTSWASAGIALSAMILFHCRYCLSIFSSCSSAACTAARAIALHLRPLSDQKITKVCSCLNSTIKTISQLSTKLFVENESACNMQYMLLLLVRG